MPNKNLSVSSNLSSETFGENLLPFPGTIIPYAGKVVPEGWLLCNGATFSQSDYPGLYAALGNSNALPNMQGYFLIGFTGTVNTNTTGNANHTHTATLSSLGINAYNHATPSNVTHSHNFNINTGVNTVNVDTTHNHPISLSYGGSYGPASSTNGGFIQWNTGTGITGVAAHQHAYSSATAGLGDAGGTDAHSHSIATTVFGSNNDSQNTNTHAHGITAGTSLSAVSNAGSNSIKNIQINYIIKAG